MTRERSPLLERWLAEVPAAPWRAPEPAKPAPGPHVPDPAELAATLEALVADLRDCYPAIDPEVLVAPIRAVLRAPGSVDPKALRTCFEQLEDLFEASLLIRRAGGEE